MTGTIPKGAVIYSRSRRWSNSKAGDIITFNPPGYSAAVTHRIIAVEAGPDGGPAFRTKGDFNEVADPWNPITLNEPQQARYVFQVPLLGYVLAALSMRAVRIALIGLPAVLIALSLLWSLWREAGEEVVAPARGRRHAARREEQGVRRRIRRPGGASSCASRRLPRLAALYAPSGGDATRRAVRARDGVGRLRHQLAARLLAGHGSRTASRGYAHQQNAWRRSRSSPRARTRALVDLGSYPDLNKTFDFTRVLTLETPARVSRSPAVTQVTVTVTLIADPGGTQPLKQSVPASHDAGRPHELRHAGRRRRRRNWTSRCGPRRTRGTPATSSSRASCSR